MICMSLRTVVYPVPRFSESASKTSRTVLGPRRQRTFRISNSASVGRGGSLFGIALRPQNLSTRKSPDTLLRRRSYCQRKSSYFSQQNRERVRGRRKDEG